MNAPVPAQRGRSARNNRSAYSSMRFSSNSNPLDVLLPWLIIPRKVPNFSFRMLPYDPRQLGSFAEHTINYVKQEDGKAKVGFRSFPCPNYDRHRHQVDPLKDDCPLCRAGIAPRASVLLNVLDTNLANNPPPGAGPWRADGSLSWSEQELIQVPNEAYRPEEDFELYMAGYSGGDPVDYSYYLDYMAGSSSYTPVRVLLLTGGAYSKVLREESTNVFNAWNNETGRQQEMSFSLADPEYGRVLTLTYNSKAAPNDMYLVGARPEPHVMWYESMWRGNQTLFNPHGPHAYTGSDGNEYPLVDAAWALRFDLSRPELYESTTEDAMLAALAPLGQLYSDRELKKPLDMKAILGEGWARSYDVAVGGGTTYQQALPPALPPAAQVASPHGTAPAYAAPPAYPTQGAAVAPTAQAPRQPAPHFAPPAQTPPMAPAAPAGLPPRGMAPSPSAPGLPQRGMAPSLPPAAPAAPVGVAGYNPGDAPPWQADAAPALGDVAGDADGDYVDEPPLDGEGEEAASYVPEVPTQVLPAMPQIPVRTPPAPPMAPAAPAGLPPRGMAPSPSAPGLPPRGMAPGLPPRGLPGGRG